VCGILIASGAGVLGGIIGKVAGPTYTVSQYYNAVEKQDYSTAYMYIDANFTVQNNQNLTQQLYTDAAQTLDTTSGKVNNYSIGNISVTNNSASITVSVTRGSTPAYDVQLQLQQVNGSWKITSLTRF
jgi:nitrogen fixation protein FixH